MSKTLSALAEPKTQQATRTRVQVMSADEVGLDAPMERATALCRALRALPSSERESLQLTNLENDRPDDTIYCSSVFGLLTSEIYAGSLVEVQGTKRAVDFVTSYLRTEDQKYR